MKGLMLSGITGAGKSTMYRKLKSSLSTVKFESFLVFSAYHSQNIIHDTDFEFESYIQELCYTLHSLKHMEGNREIGVLFENSIYNSCMENKYDTHQIKTVEETFQKINTKQVLLVVDDSEIYNRSIVLTRKFRKPSWSEYLNKFDLSDENLTKMFLEKQNKLKQYLENSKSPKLILNTTAMDWDKYIGEIINFWEN